MFGLQPHRTRNFKFTTDPKFVEKLRDVVGLYLNPPDKLWGIASMRRAISVLERTQPLFPWGSATSRASSTSRSFSAVTGQQTAGYDTAATTPAYALVVKPPGDHVSLYANYIEGLASGTVVPDQYSQSRPGAAAISYPAV